VGGVLPSLLQPGCRAADIGVAGAMIGRGRADLLCLEPGVAGEL